MRAYLDTSALVAVAFAEPAGAEFVVLLNAAESVLSAPLLEAEFRSACRREARTVNPYLLDEVDWVSPRRSLAPEIARVLDAGYVRGADCWHLATALYAARGRASDMRFVTHDRRQREVAGLLGFLI